MATFDADAYRKAREPWAITLNGVTHVARPISAELVIRVSPALNGGDSDQVTRALEQLLRAAFPWRVWMWWRGDPVAQILALDTATRRAAVTSFFLFLGGESSPPPETSGTP